MSIADARQNSVAWRAVQSKPRYEKVVAALLTEKGFEILLPTYTSRRKRSDRYVDLTVPLFPTYLFCRCRGTHLTPVLNTCGVVRVVGTRENPAIVDDEEIDRLSLMMHSKLDLEPWDFVSEGQLVKIQNGPLRGLTGIVIGRDPHKRKFLVSIMLLQRSATVSLQPEWVELEQSA
jgi:transcription termination/antitermination protein NusG